MHLNDAFRRNADLKITCFHHEQAAAIAAEAHYRYNHRLCVLNVTTGPGGINSLNGVFGAFVDSMAMLVISGQVKRETYIGSYNLPLRQLGDQEADVITISRTLVKYGTVVTNPVEIRSVIDKALFLATFGRPGPVWIDVPIDVQAAIIDQDELHGWSGSLLELMSDIAVTPTTRSELEAHSKKIDDKPAVKRISEMLFKSKRPVFFFGNGVRLANVTEQVLNVAEALNIPVVTGWNAHDLLPNDHQCYTGRPGTVGDRAGNFTVQNSDFILILGCRLNIRQISYNFKSFASKAWRAMIDIDPNELLKPTLSIDYAVCMDLKQFIPAFINEIGANVPKLHHKEYLEWCKQKVKKYPVVLPKYRQRASPLNPYVFLEEFLDILPDEAAIVVGNGSACVMTFQAARIRKGQRIFTNSGNASMGYDLPAAIGVAIARPDRPTYCIAGDGSLMMNLQEIQTVIGYGLAVKIIVLNNNGYLSIKQTQQTYFSDNVFGTGPENGVTMPDFVKLAEGFGLLARRVEDIDTLRSPEIRNLLNDNKPLLLDVIVDQNQAFSPKLASRKLGNGTMVSPSLEDMAPFLTRDELAENTIQDE